MWAESGQLVAEDILLGRDLNQYRGSFLFDERNIQRQCDCVGIGVVFIENVQADKRFRVAGSLEGQFVKYLGMARGKILSGVFGTDGYGLDEPMFVQVVQILSIHCGEYDSVEIIDAVLPYFLYFLRYAST